MKKRTNPDAQFQWTKYAGLASQWAIVLVILLFVGRYLDNKHFFNLQGPLFIWVLPFLFIILSLIDIIKKTNSKTKP